MVFAFASQAFAANVEYTDYDATTACSSDAYEAVEALSGAGIVNGIGNNEFGNDIQFTREQAAMIIYRILVGVDTANAVTKVDKAPFTDVPADHWSAAAIAFCADEEIVAGCGDGTFNPQGDLTREAWLKMLLVAVLGRDQAKDHLVGDDWDVHAATLGINMGIVSTEEYKADFTREMAALYAYNALLIKGSMEQSNTFDVYGAPATKDVAYKGKPVASFPVANDDSYGNVKGGVKVADIAKTLPKGADIAVYVDGQKVNDAVVGGRGVQVGVYPVVAKDGSVAGYRIVEINTYVGFATNIKPATKTTSATYQVAYGKDAKGDTLYYTFKGEAKEGDIVVYTVGNEKPEAAPYKATAYRQENAPTLGTITATSGNYGNYSDDMYVGIDNVKTYFNVNAVYYPYHVKAIVGVYSDKYGNVLYLDDDPALAPISDMQRIYLLDTSIYAESSGTVTDDITEYEYTSKVILQSHAIVWDDTQASIETLTWALVEENGRYYLLDQYGYATKGVWAPSLPGTETVMNELLKAVNDTVAANGGHNVSISGITFPAKGVTVTIKNNFFAEAYVTEDGEYVITNPGDVDLYIDNQKGAVGVERWNGDAVDATEYYVTDDVKATYLTYCPTDRTASVEVVNGRRDLKPAGSAPSPMNNMIPEFVQGVVVLNDRDKATEVVVLNIDLGFRDTYGIYLGVLEDNEGGRAYAFGLSDGNVAVLYYNGDMYYDDYNLWSYVPGTDRKGFNLPKAAEIIWGLFHDDTDYAKVMGELEDTPVGTVCKIATNTQGKITGVLPMEATASGYVEDIDTSRIYLGGNVTYPPYAVPYDFARDFGMKGYKTEFDWTVTDYTDEFAPINENDYVYLYTAPGMAPGSEEVVFITVGHKTVTEYAIYVPGCEAEDDIKEIVKEPVEGGVYEIVYNVDDHRIVGGQVRNEAVREVSKVTKIADANAKLLLTEVDDATATIDTLYTYADMMKGIECAPVVVTGETVWYSEYSYSDVVKDTWSYCHGPNGAKFYEVTYDKDGNEVVTYKGTSKTGVEAGAGETVKILAHAGCAECGWPYEGIIVYTVEKHS